MRSWNPIKADLLILESLSHVYINIYISQYGYIILSSIQSHLEYTICIDQLIQTQLSDWLCMGVICVYYDMITSDPVWAFHSCQGVCICSLCYNPAAKVVCDQWTTASLPLHISSALEASAMAGVQTLQGCTMPRTLPQMLHEHIIEILFELF